MPTVGDSDPVAANGRREEIDLDEIRERDDIPSRLFPFVLPVSRLTLLRVPHCREGLQTSFPTHVEISHAVTMRVMDSCGSCSGRRVRVIRHGRAEDF